MMKLVLVLSAALSLASAGCAPEGTACPAYVVVGPLTNLSYPVPSSTGVPDGVGILIFSGSPRQQIRIVAAATGATPLAVTPTALPSPLPAPIATPADAAHGYYAVAVPSLEPMTTYAVAGLATEHFGCGGTSSEYAGGGSFTTQ